MARGNYIRLPVYGEGLLFDTLSRIDSNPLSNISLAIERCIYVVIIGSATVDWLPGAPIGCSKRQLIACVLCS